MSPALFWLDERTGRRTARETAFQRTAAQKPKQSNFSCAALLVVAAITNYCSKSPKWQIKRIADVSTLLRRNNKPKLCALKSQYSTQVDIRLFRAGRKQDSATAVLPFRSIPWAHIYRALQCRVLVPPSEARGEEVRKKKRECCAKRPRVLLRFHIAAIVVCCAAARDAICRGSSAEHKMWRKKHAGTTVAPTTALFF